jgi:hypothetical protein
MIVDLRLHLSKSHKAVNHQRFVNTRLAGVYMQVPALPVFISVAAGFAGVQTPC